MAHNMIDDDTAKFIDAWMDDNSDLVQLIAAKVAKGTPKRWAVREAMRELGYRNVEVSLEVNDR